MYDWIHVSEIGELGGSGYLVVPPPPIEERRQLLWLLRYGLLLRMETNRVNCCGLY